MNTYTLEEGRRQKAEGRRQKAEGKEKFKGRRFFITNYPDMILKPFLIEYKEYFLFFRFKR
ncbi:MAG: hypothetical protein F6K39_12000 [Okeania sp. SIO3B3]|nr:hypothetical protein [Okeania sp. SIO3B3]